MASSLLDSTFDDGDYVSESFKTVLEDHLSILSNPKNIEEFKTISPIDANRFEYDFYGLLRNLAVPVQHHWITMRINGYSSPSEYKKDKLTIKIPRSELINSLLSYHNQIVKRTAS